MKTCAKCKVQKPKSDFCKRSRSKDGINYYCRECEKATAKSYYENNKDRCLAAGINWVKSNAQRNKINQKEWKANNKQKMKEYFAKRYREKRNSILAAASVREAKRYAESPERRAKIKADLVRWRKENPETFLAQATNRRARIAGAEGSHTAEEVKKLYAFQKGKCAACKAILKDGYHKDHIAPLKPRNGGVKGTNYITNIQLFCGSCNSKKNNKDPIKFMQEMGYLL